MVAKSARERAFTKVLELAVVLIYRFFRRVELFPDQYLKGLLNCSCALRAGEGDPSSPAIVDAINSNAPLSPAPKKHFEELVQERPPLPLMLATTGHRSLQKLQRWLCFGRSGLQGLRLCLVVHFVQQQIYQQESFDGVLTLAPLKHKMIRPKP